MLAATSSPASSSHCNSSNRNHVDILTLLKRLEDDNNDSKDVVVRFFCLNDQDTEVFGRSAEIVCDLIFRTESGMKRCFDGQTPYLTLTSGQLGMALRELVLSESGEYLAYVELWSKTNNIWKCDRKASPGNLEAIEDVLLGDNENIASDLVLPDMAPLIAGIMVGPCPTAAYWITMVYVDIGHNIIGYCEFADGELLLNTEVTLAQLACRQVIFIGNSIHDKLQELLQLNGILGTPLPSKQFDSHVGAFDFSRLVLKSLIIQASMLSSQAHAVGAALFSYLQIFRHDCNLESFSLQLYDSRSFMRLDESALKGLNIFGTSPPTLPGTSNRKSQGKWQSLHSLLSQYCKTPQGSKLLAQWLRQPLLDPIVISQRLDIVEWFIADPEIRLQLRETLLKGIHDLGRINRKLQRNRASLQDLAVLFDVLSKCQMIFSLLSSPDRRQAMSDLLINPLGNVLNDCQPLMSLLRESLDFEAMVRHEYLIKATFDPSLGDLAVQKNKILQSLEREASQVAQTINLELGKKLKLECNPGTYGHFLRVSRLDDRALNGLRKGVFYELAVLKSGVLFQTHELKTLSQQYEELSSQYVQKQAMIVKEIRETVGTFRPLIERLNIIIAMLDSFTALAQAALTTPGKPWARPQVMAFESTLKIVHGRHPLLEAKMAEEGDIVTENNADLNDQDRFGIITGPNMGGKSTFLRQVGIIAVLAQIGSFVPANSAMMPVFDAVLLRVGAGDDLFKGISTFLAEMLQVASILGSMTNKSLILVDELGRGTSCEEGAAIARSIAEYIVTETKSKCFFATHFHELAERLLPGMFCLQVDLEHKLSYGSAQGKSMGIDLARKMGFPTKFLQRAQFFYDWPDLRKDQRVVDWIMQQPEREVCDLVMMETCPEILHQYLFSK